MSALQQGAYALGLVAAWAIGCAPRWYAVHRWKAEAAKWQDAAKSFARQESESSVRAASAEKENNWLRMRLASGAMESNRLRRELNRAQSAPPRAGVDA